MNEEKKSKKLHKTKEQTRIVALETQLEEVTTDLQRIQADFVNYKRRAEDDTARSVRFGRESAIMALLPVVDNIERALGHVPADLQKHDFALGVRSIAKQVEDALKGLGVEKITSVGQPFNPDMHEAISMDDDGDGQQEVVVEEMQPGYTMDGEVIRHAMVKVGRK